MIKIKNENGCIVVGAGDGLKRQKIFYISVAFLLFFVLLVWWVPGLHPFESLILNLILSLLIAMVFLVYFTQSATHAVFYLDGRVEKVVVRGNSKKKEVFEKGDLDSIEIVTSYGMESVKNLLWSRDRQFTVKLKTKNNETITLGNEMIEMSEIPNPGNYSIPPVFGPSSFKTLMSYANLPLNVIFKDVSYVPDDIRESTRDLLGVFKVKVKSDGSLIFKNLNTYPAIRTVLYTIAIAVYYLIIAPLIYTALDYGYEMAILALVILLPALVFHLTLRLLRSVRVHVMFNKSSNYIEKTGSDGTRERFTLSDVEKIEVWRDWQKGRRYTGRLLYHLYFLKFKNGQSIALGVSSGDVLYIKGIPIAPTNKERINLGIQKIKEYLNIPIEIQN